MRHLLAKPATFLSVGLLCSAPALWSEDRPGTAPAAPPPAAKPETKPAVAVHWQITLDDDGQINGVILSKSATVWVVRTDDNRTVEIARERIRSVKPQAPAATEGDGKGEGKPHSDRGPDGGKPGSDAPKPPAENRPPEGDAARPKSPPPPQDGNAGKPGAPAGGDKPRAEGAPKNQHPRATVKLKNGQIINGRVEKSHDGGATIRTEKGDLVDVTKDQVASFELLDK